VDIRDWLEGSGDQKLGNYVIMMMRRSRMGVATAAVLFVVVSCGQCGILALESGFIGGGVRLGSPGSSGPTFFFFFLLLMSSKENQIL
jgi:hypothetical protein